MPEARRDLSPGQFVAGLLVVACLVFIVYLFATETRVFDRLLDRSERSEAAREHFYSLGAQDAARGARLTEEQMERAGMSPEQRKAYRAGHDDGRYAR